MNTRNKVAVISIDSSKSKNVVLPWASLALLASTYIMFGLFIAESSIDGTGWFLAIFGAVCVTIVITFPQFNIERQVTQWLRSATGTFIMLAISAALISVFLLWIHVFLKIIAILAANALVKLELRRNFFGHVQSFFLILIASLVGLSLGWLVHTSI